MKFISSVLGSVLRIVAFALFAVVAVAVTVIFFLTVSVRGLLHRMRRTPRSTPGDDGNGTSAQETIVIGPDGTRIR